MAYLIVGGSEVAQISQNRMFGLWVYFQSGNCQLVIRFRVTYTQFCRCYFGSVHDS
jgi:hypothetical protein